MQDLESVGAGVHPFLEALEAAFVHRTAPEHHVAFHFFTDGEAFYSIFVTRGFLGLQVVPKQRYSFVFLADFPYKFEATLNCLCILEADMPWIKANQSLVSVQCVSCAFYQSGCAGCFFKALLSKNATLKGNGVGSRAACRPKLHADLPVLLLICSGVLSSVYIWLMVSKATTFYWRCQRWPERVLCQEFLVSKFNKSKDHPAHIFQFPVPCFSSWSSSKLCGCFTTP